MTEQTIPAEELSNLHDTLAYFKRQAAKGHTAFASRLSEIEAQIATLEADILSVYPTAPVVEAAQPDDGCPLCGGDGINKAGSASCPACNGSGYANEPALEATAQNDDIVARLEDAAETYSDYACDCDTDLYTAAAEIRRLRAALAKAELAEDDDRRARERAKATLEEYVRITDEQITALKADAEKARGEVAALRELITPRVDVTPMYDIWGCKGKVYLGSVKVFETDWYDDKDRAREAAQAFSDTLTAELTQR